MKNGFTLIELLAVIVILAIIALIATPIVLNIINDTKESATLRSADFYVDAVENEIMLENMKVGGSFNPGYCDINKGNINCEGKADTIIVKVDGEVPTSGRITFENGKAIEVELVYGNNVVTKQGSEFVINYEPPKEKWIKLNDGIISNPDRVGKIFLDKENLVYSDRQRSDFIYSLYKAQFLFYYDFSQQKFIENSEYIDREFIDYQRLGDKFYTFVTNNGVKYYSQNIQGPYYSTDVDLIAADEFIHRQVCKLGDGYFFTKYDDGIGAGSAYYLDSIGGSFVLQNSVIDSQTRTCYNVDNKLVVSSAGGYYYKETVTDEWAEYVGETNYCYYSKLGDYYYNSNNHSYSESCNGPWTEMGKLTYDGKNFKYGIVEDKLIAYYEKSKGHYLLFYTNQLDNLETYDYKD